MTRGARGRIVGRDEGAVDLVEPLGAVLQGLRDVVASAEARILIKQDVEFGPHAVAGVVRLDALEALYDGGEAPS